MRPVEFLTEKQIEGLLERETRDLPMPDGSLRPLTDFKLMWETYDRLILLGDYTPARLVGFALEETQLSGAPFEKTFPGCVAYLDHHLRDSFIDKKIAEMKDRLQRQKGIAKSSFNRASKHLPL